MELPIERDEPISSIKKETKMMQQSTLDGIIPAQHKGRKAKVQIPAICYSEDASRKLYEFLKISLADVDHWGEFKPGISFYPKLINRNGEMLRRIAKPGDLIKILLPRWQAAGRLYDWRQITRIEERLYDNTEIFFITIVPAMNPELEAPEASHFLRAESTVTFFVIRDGNKLQLEVHTRNEGLNFQLSGFKTRLQSALMGVFIAGGFYESQWTKLLKSILKYGMLQMKIAN
jgi:hypothetical protein